MVKEIVEGNISVEMHLSQSTRTSKETLNRIKATLCGLQFLLSKNEDEIVRLGEAYLDGVEVGMNLTIKEKEDKDELPKVGFRANL